VPEMRVVEEVIFVSTRFVVRRAFGLVPWVKPS
jgi:hypothetical protein